MFPQKISQNIDILARIHGNVFPWQPTIMGNKASYYKSMFQISLPWLYLSFHNACPRHLKSRRDLLYLGVNISAGKRFETPTRKPLMSFYCSANTILNVLNKPSEQVLMKLLYSSCVPILTYGCEVKRHTGREMTSLDVALNDCIRKIFGYNRWESTRELRRSLGYESITEIFAKRNSRFLNGLFRTGNSVLIRLKSLSIS